MTDKADESPVCWAWAKAESSQPNGTASRRPARKMAQLSALGHRRLLPALHYHRTHASFITCMLAARDAAGPFVYPNDTLRTCTTP